MQKWEYCYVCHHYFHGSEEIFVVKNDGTVEKKYKGDEAVIENAILLINKLGNQGWEVMGATLSSDEHGWTLKRPIENR